MESCRAIRVHSSLRRGSSWPLVIETEKGVYLTKLTGAGHGFAALIAEVLVAGLAEALGLRVPVRSLILIDNELECDNRDPELLELLRASRGLNLGFEFLHGAREMRAGEIDLITEDDASIVSWLDWLVLNHDRTARNPNILIRQGTWWLIDHGAALVFQHDWAKVTEDSPGREWDPRDEHLLAARATRVAEWAPLLAAQLSRDVITSAAYGVPDEFIKAVLPPGATPETIRRRKEAYATFLWKRLRSGGPLLVAGAGPYSS